ncbi:MULTISPECIES: MerR family transcriptional regulator [Desulfitobacterium]|uniref:HTH merR-type domain-containing protein n=4 Tax=root TaxID=1 RepID=Q24SY9_DESHY|nr:MULTISPECIES: MerR family transcriptional regulator [Desulfitobacterium]EHL04655.1 hypothetical protein HMPREF0322_04746 [Desulfitobacterium hafniense DP7]KTE92062.1 MerR family transcriptional regulator [Desulfitobacterium hafniense]MEA5021341.1 MerR family transcriptional regulator [Desulfitobacterium hafniense]BAE84853.1 hypothetical protein DSY3064 [Desulfitobacterium hafniense Y51]
MLRPSKVVIILLDEEKGLYSIGTVAELIEEHPETLRVWERNGLIHPNRDKYQRKYSNNDLLRLKFIKYLMNEKGLNIAGVKQITSMYSCWYNRNCKGGGMRSSTIPINESKPCWKIEGTYCFIASDKSELCSTCEMLKTCASSSDCK